MHSTPRLSDRWTRAREAAERRVSVDARVLAAFRIALGAVVLLNVVLRARSLEAFYTDAGVLPRTALRAAYPVLSQVSIHALSGALWWQVVLFALAGACALAFALGYRTRLAAFASFVLMVSLHARNPVVLNAGDSLLRRLLLWSVLLPLGRRWAVDATDAEGAGGRVASVATTGLLVQVVAVYAVNAAFKLRGDAWLSGEAVRDVFSLDQFVILLGDVLQHFPTILVAADYAWLSLLVASPLLLLVTGRARTTLASLFVLGHLGMLVTMRLGVFPLVSMTALLPFLHGGVWDRVEAHTPDWSTRRPARIRPRVPRRLVTGVAVVLLAFVLVWNAAAVGILDTPDDAAVQPSEQSWDMFAPEPLATDGWYVAPARLSSGERVDAWNGGRVSWKKPPDVAATYPSARWRKYLVSIYRTDPGLQDEFARSLCRQWAASHPTTLDRVAVYFVTQPTRLDAPDPIRRIRLQTIQCVA